MGRKSPICLLIVADTTPIVIDPGMFGNRRGTFCLGFTEPGERPVRDGNNFNAQSEAEIDIIAVFTKCEWRSGSKATDRKSSSRLPFTCFHFRLTYTPCIYKRLRSILYWNMSIFYIRCCALLPLDTTSFNFCCWNKSGWYMNDPETTLHTNTRNFSAT